MAGQPERQRNARQTQATMALRDPAAAKGVQVVAHFPRQRMDAVVERIDWHKVDARATSEEALEDVLISFDWKGKRWTGPIAEESLTLRDGSPFRTKDYELAVPAARKKTKTRRLVELVEKGQTYADDESCAYCGGSTCLSDPRCDEVLICDGCEAQVHLRCAALAAVPEEDWFCHQCSTIDNIVEKVNEYFDKNYTCAGWKDVFAKEEEEVRVPTGGILDMDFGSGDDEDDEDHVSGDESDDEEDDASDVVSRCSGDVALGVKVPEDKIDVRNILDGPRKKQKLDYAALNAALSDAESDDGGAFYASLPKPRPPSDDEDNAAGKNGDGDSEGDFDA